MFGEDAARFAREGEEFALSVLKEVQRWLGISPTHPVYRGGIRRGLGLVRLGPFYVALHDRGATGTVRPGKC
jgi:hypothetical protein